MLGAGSSIVAIPYTNVQIALGVGADCMRHVSFSRRSAYMSQQTEIFIPRDAPWSQVVPDNCDRDFAVGRNDDGPGNARFNVRAMASLLPSKPKASGNEDFSENCPVCRCYSWHLGSDSDDCRASFDDHPRRTHPTSLAKFIAAFLENVL
jgi:hypothetical protein